MTSQFITENITIVTLVIDNSLDIDFINGNIYSRAHKKANYTMRQIIVCVDIFYTNQHVFAY